MNVIGIQFDFMNNNHVQEWEIWLLEWEYAGKEVTWEQWLLRKREDQEKWKLIAQLQEDYEALKWEKEIEDFQEKQEEIRKIKEQKEWEESKEERKREWAIEDKEMRKEWEEENKKQKDELDRLDAISDSEYYSCDDDEESRIMRNLSRGDGDLEGY